MIDGLIRSLRSFATALILPLGSILGLLALACCFLPGSARGQSGEIRATPIQPVPDGIRAQPIPEADEEVLDTRLKFANMLYNYRRYEGAAQRYTEFLNAAPKDPQAPGAWFRLGDSYRRLKLDPQALQCLETYLKLAPNGEFAAPAAFTVARLHFNANQFGKSVPFWAVAVAKLDDASLREESRFFHAQALRLSGKKDDALKVYEVLLKSRTPTRYRDHAELELARLQLEAGKREESRVHFANLAASAKDPLIKDEARFRAGILGLETGDKEKAEAMLTQSLESSKNDSFKQLAQMALMQRAYERKDYNEVIRLYSLAPLVSKGKARAQLEMMVANSFRQNKNLAQAIRIFSNVERDFKGTAEATEAGYRKLVCFHEAGDKDLARYVDAYLAAQSKVDASVNYIDLALLLKGETLFRIGDYDGAAQAYRNVRINNVDKKYAPARLYKMGWAMTESDRDAEGIDALGEFVSEYHDSPLVPSALMKRAITFNKQENYDSALKDYQRIVDDHPESENTEYAMTQIALIQRHLRRLEPMVEAYQALLQRFPKSELRAEASYWIGGGLFDLKRYEDSLAPLTEARELNEKQFGENASLRLIFAHYHLEREDDLLRETRAYRSQHGEPDLLDPVFGYLGRTFYDKQQFEVAEPYLSLRSDPDAPKQTPPDIWRKLGDVHIAMGSLEKAVSDLDNYLLHEQHIEHRARAILDKAKCLLQLGRLPEGQAASEEVLKLVRNGRLNAEARILIGDLYLAQNDPTKAIQFYTIVVEFGADKVMVPKAMEKMVKALEAKGEPTKAANYEKRLKSEFPNYKSAG